MPVDSDPGDPGRAREAAAPGRRAALDAAAGPDAARAANAAGWTEQPDRTGRPERPEQPGRAAHREAPAAAEPVTLRQQQAAEHLRYQRAVDEAYQAAAGRRAWDQAVPELRASWEEHKQRFPERSRAMPSTRPDGSWAAEGGRGLTPEQNAEAAKACADLRDEAGKDILPAMRRVAEASPDGRLAGLNHMLKGEDRLKEKIADELLAKPEKIIRDAIGEIADPVRFTLTYPSERYADGVRVDIGRLKEEGFELIKLKNLWLSEQYKGVNSQWRRPDTGTRIEVQFHTPESLEAKELTHAAYERIRGPEASPTERRQLRAFQRHVNDQLTDPPRNAEINEFPEKK